MSPPEQPLGCLRSSPECDLALPPVVSSPRPPPVRSAGRKPDSERFWKSHATLKNEAYPTTERFARPEHRVGRYAECGAGEYLEFDHIVPVAKGGSNSDSTVQLLCQKCNVKKSDNI